MGTPHVFQESSQKVADSLLEIGAVKVSINPPFTWTSGIKSPVYCDNRQMIAFPDHRQIVVDAFVALLKEKALDVDVIAGTATAAIPWAAFLAYALNKPMVYVRPKKKEHGAGKQIEGSLKPGSRVLLVEDLISTGGSSLKAVEALTDEGQSHVTDVFAIVTYEFEKSVQAFSEAGIQLTTLTSFSVILDQAVVRGDITGDDLEKILEFRKDPATWADRVGI